jgi:hypothetical protein
LLGIGTQVRKGGLISWVSMKGTIEETSCRRVDVRKREGLGVSVCRYDTKLDCFVLENLLPLCVFEVLLVTMSMVHGSVRFVL